MRFEPSKEQPAPAISKQYAVKPWKVPPEKPKEPVLATRPKKPAPIKPQIGEDDPFERKQIMDALSFEHPVVTLKLDRLTPNVRAVVKDDSVTNTIVNCIRGAVRVAWETKRRGQVLIGLYLEDLFYRRPTPDAARPAVPVTTISDEDLTILDALCPRLYFEEMDASDDQGFSGDGDDGGSNTDFILCFLIYLYSGNLPRNNSKAGASVNTFIRRLQDMHHLGKHEQDRGKPRNIKEYTPSNVVRSVASQLSAELRRHYKTGAQEISEKVIDQFPCCRCEPWTNSNSIASVLPLI